MAQSCSVERKRRYVGNTGGKMCTWSQSDITPHTLSQSLSPWSGEEIDWNRLCTSIMIHSPTQQECQLFINQSRLLEGKSARLPILSDLEWKIIYLCVWVVVCVYLRFPLKDDHSAPFVPCRQELSSVVELDSGDDISWGREARMGADTEEERERENGWERTVRKERDKAPIR